jgi:plastocyanin
VRPAALVVASAIVAAAALSCFSDQPGATGPIDDTPECVVPGFAIGANHVVVFVRRFEFFPDTLRIRPGTSVTWVNCEEANVEPHTTSADQGAWDSPFLSPGESFTHTFLTAGSFGYFCRPHPFMRGQVIVQ